MAQPTAYDQYVLELINRARSAPSAEAARDGIGLNDGLASGTLSSAPKQPLAFNPDLIAAAQGHSAWIMANDTFSHTGAGGSSPGDRMAAAGYDFAGSYGWGENIGLVGGTNLTLNQATVDSLEKSLFVDSNEPGVGHRVNILNPDWREVGVGVASGPYTYDNGASLPSSVVTQDFAYSGGGSFLTGVAYDDQNSDVFYEPGEGLGGLTVQATSSTGQSYQTTTWNSGGYQLQLPAGTYKVAFSGGTLPVPVVETATIASQNVKLDLVRGSAPLSTTPTPPPPSAPSVADGGTFGIGPDTLVVNLAEDAYKGDAQAKIFLDGASLTAAPLTVTASHAAGAGEVFTFKGTFGAGAHDLAVGFVNDAYDGTPSTDRNLYVNSASYDGIHPNGSGTAVLYSAGTTHFATPPAF